VLAQDYPVYPPSLYRAISYVSTLGVPIYIMENGIPAPPNDPSRKRWIVGCLQQVGLCCGPTDCAPTCQVICPKQHHYCEPFLTLWLVHWPHVSTKR
jgi:hypothetical protein